MRKFYWLPFLALFLILTSCVATIPAVSSQGMAAQSGVLTLQGDLNNAGSNLAQAAKGLKVTLPQIPVITTNVDNAALAVGDAQKQAGSLALNVTSLTTERDKLAAKINATQDDLFGPKGHRILAYLIIAVVLFGIGAIALQAAPTIGIPFLASMATIIGHIFTLATGYLTKGVGKLAASTVNFVANVPTPVIPTGKTVTC